MLKVLCVLAGSNLAVCTLCYSSLITTPGAGPEGLGTAALGFVSVLLSILLTGFCLNQLLREFRQGSVNWREPLVTFLAAAPLLIHLIFDVLRLHTN
jgi:ABC-type Fe3+-siderophore transport system permease subunit